MKRRKTPASEVVLKRMHKDLRTRARVKARDALCLTCPNKRCLDGSVCKAFVALSDILAWEIAANSAELN